MAMRLAGGLSNDQMDSHPSRCCRRGKPSRLPHARWRRGNGRQILIAVVLILFLLVLFGVIAIA
jgi:hypothetical protein